MEWSQYYWNCLLSAYNQPFVIVGNISLVLSIIIGIIAWKHPKWSERMNRRILWVLAGLFIILFVIGLLSASYNMYLKEHEQVEYLNSELSSRLSTLEQELAIMQMTSSHNPTVFYSKSITLAEIKSDGQITNKLFKDCDFMGQSEKIHFAGCTILDSISEPSTSFVVVHQLPPGTLEFQNCLIINCRFWNITIVGTSNEIENYSKLIIPRE